MTMIEDNIFANKEILYDDGCEYSNSCLNCALPLCKYDDPILDNSKIKTNRNTLIYSMKKTNLSNKKIAEIFKISTRTVHRILTKDNTHKQKFVLELRNQSIIKKSQLVSMQN